MPSIPDTLRRTAARCPDRDALVFGGRRSTYRKLHEEVERSAAAIAAHGIVLGDRVLLMGTNRDAFVIAVYAVLRTGAIPVPANPHSAPPELAHVLGDSGAPSSCTTPGARRSSPPVPSRRAPVRRGCRWPSSRIWPPTRTRPSVTHHPGESDDALLCILLLGGTPLAMTHVVLPA
jgi:non-ribosomal peptide synthetase component F